MKESLLKMVLMHVLSLVYVSNIFVLPFLDPRPAFDENYFTFSSLSLSFSLGTEASSLSLSLVLKRVRKRRMREKEEREESGSNVY